MISWAELEPLTIAGQQRRWVERAHAETNFRYSEIEWTAIRHRLPRGSDEPPLLRKMLEVAADKYLREVAQPKKSRWTARKEQQSWNRVARAASQLSTAFYHLRLGMGPLSYDRAIAPFDPSNKEWESFSNVLASIPSLARLREQKAREDREKESPHPTIATSSRDGYLWSIAMCWVSSGGKLKTATTKKRQPSGPLLRFYMACAEPAFARLSRPIPSPWALQSYVRKIVREFKSTSAAGVLPWW